jgi:hypothetical protein
MTSYLVLQASQAFLRAITLHNHVQKEEEETKGLTMGQGVRIPTFGNLSSLP